MPTPEALARQQIDQLLTASGWTIQNYRKMNLYASRGVAAYEFPVEAGLKRAVRLSQSILRSAFEGRLV